MAGEQPCNFRYRRGNLLFFRLGPRPFKVDQWGGAVAVGAAIFRGSIIHRGGVIHTPIQVALGHRQSGARLLVVLWSVLLGPIALPFRRVFRRDARSFLSAGGSTVGILGVRIVSVGARARGDRTLYRGPTMLAHVGELQVVKDAEGHFLQAARPAAVV
ncbi:hypothetical protein BSZ35_19235 [Salinibacter sp. 10B]|nr:hypothetical protein BSZ35_19235 [Salinibacter sp. 10B]